MVWKKKGNQFTYLNRSTHKGKAASIGENAKELSNETEELMRWKGKKYNIFKRRETKIWKQYW